MRVGQPVVTDAGLLGRVTEVAPRAARVLLVSDTESRVRVRIVQAGAPALLAGLGGGMAELRFVSAGPEGAPKIGDLLVTSGEGGLFAPDTPVARVVGLKGETARALPLARDRRARAVSPFSATTRATGTSGANTPPSPEVTSRSPTRAPLGPGGHEAQLGHAAAHAREHRGCAGPHNAHRHAAFGVAHQQHARGAAATSVTRPSSPASVSTRLARAHARARARADHRGLDQRGARTPRHARHRDTPAIGLGKA